MRMLHTSLRIVLTSGNLEMEHREQDEDEWSFGHIKNEKDWKQNVC